MGVPTHWKPAHVSRGRCSSVIGGDQQVDFLNTACAWGRAHRSFSIHGDRLEPFWGRTQREHVTCMCCTPGLQEQSCKQGLLRHHVIQHGKSPSRSTRRGALFRWLWASLSNSKALHFLSRKMRQIKNLHPPPLIYRNTAVKRTLCPVSIPQMPGIATTRKLQPVTRAAVWMCFSSSSNAPAVLWLGLPGMY